jgi:tetratricopeptide (TPR) repeat protein
VALENALETLRVESKYQGKTGQEQRVRLRYLDDRFESRWGGIGSVATAFAQAWDALGDRAAAIGWYERAVAAQDGSAATWAIEQLANLRIRKAWDDVVGVSKDDRKSVRAKATADAREQIDEGIKLLEKLIAIQPSMERWNMLGSAYKRLAMVLDAAGEPSSKAIAEMQSRYRQAELAGRKAGLANLFYPMLNSIAAELISRDRTRKPLDPDRVAEIRQVLDVQMREDPEFWAAAGQIELTMYEALASREGLPGKLKQIMAQYQDLNARVKAKSMWASVYEQAGFVLSRCIPRTAKTERDAAAKLLKLLASFA